MSSDHKADVFSTIADYRAWRSRIASDARIALVPTMGALHEGHRALIDHARKNADMVVVSIFVNPLQFGPGEDLEKYPRTLASDLSLCDNAEVSAVFTPSVEEMYPDTPLVTVSAGLLGTVLEGAARPGHFDGVLTVVSKLFNIISPHVAVFGQKDAQQLTCIRRLVRDLDFSVEIQAVPIKRDLDGLALSSRNTYLSPEEREAALSLPLALAEAQRQAAPLAAHQAAQKVFTEAAARSSLFQPGYVQLVDADTLQDVSAGFTGEAYLLLAARVGNTRLIDNKLLRFAENRG